MSGRRANAKVVQRASVEVDNRFAVLKGGEKVREEPLVMGGSIVRLVDAEVCIKGPPKCVRICLPGAVFQAVRNRVASVVGPREETNDVDKKESEEVIGRYRELVRQIVLSGILPMGMPWTTA